MSISLIYPVIKGVQPRHPFTEGDHYQRDIMYMYCPVPVQTQGNNIFSKNITVWCQLYIHHILESSLHVDAICPAL